MGKRDWPARVLRRVVEALGSCCFIGRVVSGVQSGSAAIERRTIGVHITQVAQAWSVEPRPSGTVRKPAPNYSSSMDFATRMAQGARTTWILHIRRSIRDPLFLYGQEDARQLPIPRTRVLGYFCAVDSHSSAFVCCLHDPVMMLSQYINGIPRRGGKGGCKSHAGSLSWVAEPKAEAAFDAIR